MFSWFLSFFLRYFHFFLLFFLLSPSLSTPFCTLLFSSIWRFWRLNVNTWLWMKKKSSNISRSSGRMSMCSSNVVLWVVVVPFKWRMMTEVVSWTAQPCTSAFKSAPFDADLCCSSVRIPGLNTAVLKTADTLCWPFCTLELQAYIFLHTPCQS